MHIAEQILKKVAWKTLAQLRPLYYTIAARIKKKQCHKLHHKFQKILWTERNVEEIMVIKLGLNKT